MGVKTELSLTQAQKLFKEFHLTQLIRTKDGVIDTTYIALGNDKEYIIKKYERDIGNKVDFDTKLLSHLHNKGLNVSKLLANKDGWYIYTKLQGSSPKTVTLQHLQKLGRFIAKLHQETKKFCTDRDFFSNYPLQNILQTNKSKHYFYYKKLFSLTQERIVREGFIHGDIFKDNTLFTQNSVALFDFIDGGDGNFAFELGVVAISFNPHVRKSFNTILLQSYNQHSPRKISFHEFEKNIKIAAKLYALLRLNHYQNTKKAKELAKLW